MSDYGAIIGGTIGAVIGGMTTFGAGAQWGWMIGSAIGGAWSASQQVIPGPKIGEIAQQTAQEGGPRPIVFGRSHPIAGNVIADGGPRIVVTRERQGKGGPKVESESAFRTYAVAFCEGEADLLQVWRNNTLVYDAEDPGMAAENAEFLKYARWFRGDYQQMPSPDLEAVLGAGNVHGHRGTAYLVLADEDVTDQRGAWSQWKVRVFRGAARSYTTPPYPVSVTDEIGVSSNARDGLVWVPPLDELGVSSHALDGVHRELIARYTMEPEEIGVTSYALDGSHRALVAIYAMNPEEIGVTSHALDGTRRQVIITYLNYEPEEINVTSYALDGTHGPA